MTAERRRSAKILCTFKQDRDFKEKLKSFPEKPSHTAVFPECIQSAEVERKFGDPFGADGSKESLGIGGCGICQPSDAAGPEHRERRFCGPIADTDIKPELISAGD